MKLEVKDLCFSYSKKDTIKDISFVANEGDVISVLGMNGVGKSTLLKCLNRLHKPKSGQILIDDKDVNTMKRIEISQKIGYVAQYGEFSDATVYENIIIGRKPYIKLGLKENDVEEINKVLKMVHIEDLASRNIYNISGGERQKVAIARALAQETPILMFDEPTSNLDLKNQIDCLKVIKDIVTENKYIALISIHDINLALRFSNKFLLLKDGTVYGFGDESIITKETIKEIYGVDCEITIQDNRKVIVVK